MGFADEMREGLRGATRRVWGRRGVKVVQRLQIRYEWRYLVLAVDGRSGKLWWTWEETMRAAAHRDDQIHAVGLPLVEQPPYAPELNPAERVFEHLRARIEGEVYPSLDAKVGAVDALLEDLDAHPARVQSLAGWQWITDAFARLPAEKAA